MTKKRVWYWAKGASVVLASLSALGAASCGIGDEPESGLGERADGIHSGLPVSDEDAERLGIVDISLKWEALPGGPMLAAGQPHASGTILARNFLLTARHNLWAGIPSTKLSKPLPSDEVLLRASIAPVPHTLTIRANKWSSTCDVVYQSPHPCPVVRTGTTPGMSSGAGFCMKVGKAPNEWTVPPGPLLKKLSGTSLSKSLKGGHPLPFNVASTCRVVFANDSDLAIVALPSSIKYPVWPTDLVIETGEFDQGGVPLNPFGYAPEYGFRAGVGGTGGASTAIDGNWTGKLRRGKHVGLATTTDDQDEHRRRSTGDKLYVGLHYVEYGDSGGPVLIDGSPSPSKLVGVVSAFLGGGIGQSLYSRPRDGAQMVESMLQRPGLFTQGQVVAGMGAATAGVDFVDVQGDGLVDIVSYGDDGGAVTLGATGEFEATVPLAYQQVGTTGDQTMEGKQMFLVRAGFKPGDPAVLVRLVERGVATARLQPNPSQSGFIAVFPYDGQPLPAWPQAVDGAYLTPYNVVGAPVTSVEWDDLVAVTPDSLYVMPATVMGPGSYYISPLVSPVPTLRDPPGKPTDGFRLVDADGDGRGDFVAWNGSGVSVMAGGADGHFASPGRLTPFDAGESPVLDHLRLADLNGDGRADLVYADQPVGSQGEGLPIRALHVRLSLAESAPAPASQFGPAAIVPLELGDGWNSRWEIGDVDGDAIPDLVRFGVFPAASGDLREIFVKSGLGDGRFGGMRAWRLPNSFASVAAAEDIFVSRFTSSVREEVIVGDPTHYSLLRAP